MSRLTEWWDWFGKAISKWGTASNAREKDFDWDLSKEFNCMPKFDAEYLREIEVSERNDWSNQTIRTEKNVDNILVGFTHSVIRDVCFPML
ncbi:MAG: hypothetical protein P8J27_09820 [Mariniblastus sp.]|nr:hypothetical protein [Mariniblastus sp.]